VITAAVLAFTTLGVVPGVGVLVGSTLAAGGIGFTLSKTRLARRFVLESEPVPRLGAGVAELVGKSGVALTVLRPAGTVDIDGRRIDVVTEGQYIEADAPVRVVAVEGTRVVVTAVPGDGVPGRQS
jgi:membrane-bound ClpP family serine protease